MSSPLSQYPTEEVDTLYPASQNMRDLISTYFTVSGEAGVRHDDTVTITLNSVGGVDPLRLPFRRTYLFPLRGWRKCFRLIRPYHPLGGPYFLLHTRDTTRKGSSSTTYRGTTVLSTIERQT